MVPNLTEDEILARVGSQSFERGLHYFHSGMVFDTRKQGSTLKARCRGSQGGPYRLEATLGPDGVLGAHCSCPVGSGGHCKHVAALLLTWRERPDEFADREELDDALERRSKPELIALVKQMLRHEPDLEWLLETPLPAAGQAPAPVDPAIYRRQAAAVFNSADEEWGVEGDIADGLLAIKEIGDGFLAQQEYSSAAAVYSAILDAVLENYETYQDEDGDLGSVIGQCVNGLSPCLAADAISAESRAAVLKQLWDLYRFDVDSGGRGLGDEAYDVLLDQTTPEERHTIAGWVRKARPAGDSWSDDWHRQVYGGFLLDLEADTLDDEAFLQICREMGRNSDLVDRLLTLGRVDEAVEAAKQDSDYDLIGLADLFVEHGLGAIADTLMQERAVSTQDSRVLEWLKKRYLSREDTAAALEMALRIFRGRPSLHDYREVRTLAQPLGRWESLRPELMALLAQDHYWSLRIEVYLDEGEVDQALEALKLEPRSWGYTEEMKLKVAAAAEETRPRASLEIYRQQAERLIAERGRGNYQAACGLLRKMRDLHARLGENESWTAYINALREQNRSLRALKEELEAARL